MILLNSSNNRKSNKIEKDIKVDEQSEKSSRSQSVKSKKDQSEKSEKSQSVKSEKSQSVKSEKRKSVKSEKRQSEHQSKELNDKIIAEKPAEIEHDKDDHNKTNEDLEKGKRDEPKHSIIVKKKQKDNSDLRIIKEEEKSAKQDLNATDKNIEEDQTLYSKVVNSKDVPTNKPISCLDKICSIFCCRKKK